MALRRKKHIEQELLEVLSSKPERSLNKILRGFRVWRPSLGMLDQCDQPVIKLSAKTKINSLQSKVTESRDPIIYYL